MANLQGLAEPIPAKFCLILLSKCPRSHVSALFLQNFLETGSETPRLDLLYFACFPHLIKGVEKKKFSAQNAPYAI